MTKREQIDEKHRELFGKKGRKDYSDEKLIAKIEKHTGEKFVIQEEKKEEVKEQPVEAATTDVVEKAPVVKKTPPSSPALHGEDICRAPAGALQISTRMVAARFCLRTPNINPMQ